MAQEEGVCAFHPTTRAVGTCDRCGHFYCQACFKKLAGRPLCSACLELPAVNYLKATRDKFWGKRDGWAWYFGIFGGLGSLSAAAGGVITSDWLEVGRAVVSAALFIAYFLLRPFARKALFLLPVLALLQLPGSMAAQSTAYSAGAEMGSVVILLLFVAAAYFDARNKLAFRIELSDDELHKLHLRTSNSSASRALGYSVLSLLLPFLGAATLWLGIRALRRVQANAWPPVGGKGTAVAAIVLSVLSLSMWCLAVASYFSS